MNYISVLMLIPFIIIQQANAADKCAMNYKRARIKRIACPKYSTKPLSVEFRVDKAGMTNKNLRNDFRQQRGSLLIRWPDGHFVQHNNFKVSTGKKIDTPSRNFKPGRLSKNHCSSQYGLAPMPNSVFIHRGIAIHSGKVTGVPASAGCIRVPLKISQALYCAIAQIPSGERAAKVKIQVNPNEELLPWQKPGTLRHTSNIQPPTLLNKKASRSKWRTQTRTRPRTYNSIEHILGTH